MSIAAPSTSKKIKLTDSTTIASYHENSIYIKATSPIERQNFMLEILK